MPRSAGLGVLAALLMTALGLQNDATAAPGDQWSLSRTNVNVRALPTTDSEVVATINPGETIIEVDAKGEWYFVNLPGRNQRGWVYGPLLDEVQNAPAASAAATPPSRQDAPALPARTVALNADVAGDPENGETVFYKCGSCHTTVEGIHAQGPSLVGVFGRSPAQADGFRYSGAMEAFAREGAVWNEETLDAFIRRPARLVKGTTMPFSGVRDPKDRRDLIAYLAELSR